MQRKINIPLSPEIREAIRQAANELGSFTALANAAGINFSQPGKYVTGKVSSIGADTYNKLLPLIRKHLPANAGNRPIQLITTSAAADLSNYDIGIAITNGADTGISSISGSAHISPDPNGVIAFQFSSKADPECHHAQDGDVLICGRAGQDIEPGAPYILHDGARVIFRRILPAANKRLTLMSNGKSTTILATDIKWKLPVIGIYRKL